jgi:hypothetical protein
MSALCQKQTSRLWFNMTEEVADLPPSAGASGKLGIADLKEGYRATKEAFD